jgi:DNA polymerase epsilon subunit 1
VYNEPDEAALLRKWFSHVRQTRPNIYVSFNGDSFDWPFIEARARFHNMSLMKVRAAWECVVCVCAFCVRM